MPLLLHSRCPILVQISGLGTGTRLSYAQTSHTADRETNIQSSLLFQSWHKCQRSEMPYYLSCFMARLFTDHSVYFYIHPTAVEIISPVESANRATHFQYKLRENHDLTMQPVITYNLVMCVGEFAHLVYLIFQTVLLEYSTN